MGLRLKKNESGKPQENADRREKDCLITKRQKGCEYVRAKFCSAEKDCSTLELHHPSPAANASNTSR